MKNILFMIISSLKVLSFCLFLSTSAVAEIKSEKQSPIKVGALMVLSGQFAMQGAAFREGVELAEDEINASGGINGRQLKIVIEDTHGTPQGASTAARKLISVDKVNAALTMSYPDTKVGGVAFQSAGIPTIALWDSSPEIDKMGDYIFSLGPWAPSTGEEAAKFGFYQLKSKSAVIVNTVEEWSTYVSDYFTKKFESLGGKVLKRYEVNPDSSDFRTILSNIKNINPELIFAPITHNIVPFFKQLKGLNLPAKIITGAIVTKEHVQTVPDAFEGVYRSEIRDPNTDEAKRLFEKYTEKFNKGVTLPWYVATGYDAVMLISASMRNGATEPIKLKKYLYTIKNFSGASKEITISEGGSSPTYEKIYRISNGEFKFIS